MAQINRDWYERNALIAYPLDESATAAIPDVGLLPTDVLVDLSLRYPSTLGLYPFLSAVSVTPRLTTLTFQVSDHPTTPTTLTPLAVVSVPSPVPTFRPLPVLPQAAGVGGWLVLGHGAVASRGTQAALQARFTSPAQSLLCRRACRPYKPLPVTGIRDLRAGQLLAGVVKLLADPPLTLTRETRTVQGISRDVIVLRLSDGVAAQPPGGANHSVLEEFAGPCGGRPDSRSCPPPRPIEFINSVSPDCDGQITLEFAGCAVPAELTTTTGFVLDCGSGLGDACPPPYLPDADGNLPTSGSPGEGGSGDNLFLIDDNGNLMVDSDGVQMVVSS